MMLPSIRLANSLKAKETRRKLKKYKVLFWMMIPALLFFFIFHYVPMYGVVLAFKDFKISEGILGSPWIGGKHFNKLFHDPYFYTVLKNTVLITFYKLIFGFPVPILFALLINEISSMRFKRAVQTVSYLPHFFSWVVMGGIFISFFSIEGPINSIIRMLGENPVIFLGSPEYFRTILVITDIFKEFGWGSIIYFAAIAGIDPSLYEAAVIDGAGRFKRAIHITIPLIVPVMIIVLLLNLSGILNAGFDQIFNMYNPLVYQVADIIDTYVYRKGLLEMEYSYSTAVGLFKSGIALILIVSVNQFIKRFGGSDHTIW